MTRWLFIILACSCFMNIPVSLAGGDLSTVPPCRGVERGYVTMNIAPNGAVLYYLSDRPITHIENTNNLTCSFRISRKVQLIEESPL